MRTRRRKSASSIRCRASLSGCVASRFCGIYALTDLQLREEKIDLENALEAESESHVNKLMRELTALRLAQQQATNGSAPPPANNALGTQSFVSGQGPSADAMLEAMRRENEQLRHRLADVERDFVRISRLNEIYREELIEHRNRVSSASRPLKRYLIAPRLAGNPCG